MIYLSQPITGLLLLTRQLFSGRVRYKKNINEDVPGLTFINKLRPVTYTLDIDGIDKASGLKEQLTTEELMSKSVAGKERHTGFVAQEVEKAANELKYGFGAIDKPKK